MCVCAMSPRECEHTDWNHCISVLFYLTVNFSSIHPMKLILFSTCSDACVHVFACVLCILTNILNSVLLFFFFFTVIDNKGIKVG